MKTQAGSVKQHHQEQKQIIISNFNMEEVAFLDASAFICYSTWKIEKILFILGIFLLQLEKKTFFGFGNDTENRSLFKGETKFMY